MSQVSLLEARNNELEIIEFLLTEELPDGSTYTGHYGINVAKVLEIIRLPSITNMPGNSDCSSLGTFNLRGRVLPLVDLAAWLGKRLVQSETNKVLVTEFCGVQAAFLVSSVTSIHRLTWDRMEAPNTYVHNYSRECVTSVLRIDDRVLFVLDMEKILASLDPSLDMSHVEVDTTPIEGAGHYHLLVVDDSSSLRHIIRSSLEKSGFRVTDKANGNEAWEYLCSLRDQFAGTEHRVTDEIQLVISDIEMPDMDGHSLTAHIRNDTSMRDMPVILFSSLITEALRAKGERVGADRQVSKPDLPRLNKIIKELITEKFGNRHLVG